MKRIIYNSEIGLIIMTPNKFIEDEFKNAIMIGEKDVPFGIKFKIIDSSDIPTEPMETWEFDLSNPNGIGLSPEEFYAKYPEYKGWAVQ